MTSRKALGNIGLIDLEEQRYPYPIFLKDRYKKEYEVLEHALEKAHKQERLLEELKDIFNRHSLRLDNMREWFNLQTLESRVLNDIEKLIKELENE